MLDRNGPLAPCRRFITVVGARARIVNEVKIIPDKDGPLGETQTGRDNLCTDITGSGAALAPRRQCHRDEEDQRQAGEQYVARQRRGVPRSRHTPGFRERFRGLDRASARAA